MRFGLFTLIGAVGTLVHYLALGVLVEIVGTGPVIASGIGAVIGALVNYVLNYRITFRSNRRHAVALPRFMGVAAAGLGVNVLVMATLVRGLAVNYWPAQVVATGFVLLCTYSGNRLWTFAQGSDNASG
jgi:putative flippase GtrA